LETLTSYSDFLLKKNLVYLQPSQNTLEYAVLNNHLQVARYLVDLGRREILEEILSNGSDINARLEPHGSALIMAIQGGNFDIAELLISRSADVDLIIQTYGTA
jgi:ankyrin repeat protein